MTGRNARSIKKLNPMVTIVGPRSDNKFGQKGKALFKKKEF